jgi:DNA repair exonuclease SbcCD nuclease subunit
MSSHLSVVCPLFLILPHPAFFASIRNNFHYANPQQALCYFSFPKKMYRLIHSADWQLGARFSQFGQHGTLLRQARIETLQRSLTLARKHHADAFLIAGDLFEDNQVDNTLITIVIDLFRAHPDIPIHILPGNHDPHTGPDSIWQRRPFLDAPANVRILREAGVTTLADGVCLIASPLHQKLSTTDPSLKLAELASTLPPDTIKIGITHGAPAIESRHQPNDFPIALNAATRAGLDYLAIGHWHNWLEGLDGGRILMPGTPEPDRFANDASGNVALVEIPARGQPPRITPLPVATFAWRTLDYDFRAPAAARATTTAALAALAPTAPRTVLRIRLHGAASPADLAETRAWLETALTSFPVTQTVNETRIALTAAELGELQTHHPILAQVLADIDRLENLATGATPAIAHPVTPPPTSLQPITTPLVTTPPTAATPSAATPLAASSPATPPPTATPPTATPLAAPPPVTMPPAATPSAAPSPATLPLAPAVTPPATTSPAAPPPADSRLTLAEAQALLAPSHVALAQLTPAFFAQLRQTLLQTLREETAPNTHP